MPACNPSGNLELTVGGGYFKNDDIQGSTHDYIIQAKTLFKTLEPNQVGFGLAVGKIAHPEINPGPNQFGNTYLYFPVSYEFNNHLVVHSNLGLLKDNGDKTIKSTFGLGAELPLKTNLLGITEIYGDDKQKPFFQIGFRYSVMPELFQIDTTLGHQFDGNSQGKWLSIGFRFTP